MLFVMHWYFRFGKVRGLLAGERLSRVQWRLRRVMPALKLAKLSSEGLILLRESIGFGSLGSERLELDSGLLLF